MLGRHFVVHSQLSVGRSGAMFDLGPDFGLHLLKLLLQG